MAGAKKRKASGAAGEVIVSRVFEAPRDLVFEAWTDPRHLERWWAPKGCSTPVVRVDLRPGGLFLYCMRMPDGKDTWGRGIYSEIVPPERIVYVDSFSDAEGNLVSPAVYGASPGFPAETLVTITFADHPRGTLVEVRHAVAGEFPERDGMEQGWNEMLDRLVAALPGPGGRS